MQLLLLGLSTGFQTGWSKMCSPRSCQRPHCPRWGFFQPDFALTSEENGWAESPLTLSYKGTKLQLKSPEQCTVQQHPRDHWGLLEKHTCLFLRWVHLVALSPFSWSCTAIAAASHWWAVVIELPLQLAAAFRAVSEVLVLCLPLNCL